MHQIACAMECQGRVVVASCPSSAAIAVPRLAATRGRFLACAKGLLLLARAKECSNKLVLCKAEKPCYCGLNESSSLNVALGSPSASSSQSRRRIDTVIPQATLQENVLVELVNGNGAASIILDDVLPQHPSNYIGYGSLFDNATLFRERFVIRFSEVGPRGTITLETLSHLLQEAATNHLIAVNYAFTPGENFDGNIAVTTRMHIEVDRYPSWRDLLEIDTWFQREGKNSVRRDWIVKNVKTGQPVAFATSTWVLMNTQTRRLTKMTSEKWAELEPHMRHTPKWALSPERRQSSSAKIPKVGEDALFKIPGLLAAEKDCDMNQHVNNIRYISWMLESIPEEVKRSYEVRKITLEYRQEASQGECVESLANLEDEAVSNSSRRFTHLIRTNGVGKEINRGRTVWRPLQ